MNFVRMISQIFLKHQNSLIVASKKVNLLFLFVMHIIFEYWLYFCLRKIYTYQYHARGTINTHARV
jgi:5-methylcytosine-specific restriction endonuclease McrBC regulatory subunit McrC